MHHRRGRRRRNRHSWIELSGHHHRHRRGALRPRKNNRNSSRLPGWLELNRSLPKSVHRLTINLFNWTPWSRVIRFRILKTSPFRIDVGSSRTKSILWLITRWQFISAASTTLEWWIALCRGTVTTETVDFSVPSRRPTRKTPHTSPPTLLWRNRSKRPRRLNQRCWTKSITYSSW